MQGGSLVSLYDDEGVVDIPLPECKQDDSKCLQDVFDNEPKYRGARGRTLNLLIESVAKFGVVRQAMVTESGDSKSSIPKRLTTVSRT